MPAPMQEAAGNFSNFTGQFHHLVQRKAHCLRMTKVTALLNSHQVMAISKQSSHPSRHVHLPPLTSWLHLHGSILLHYIFPGQWIVGCSKTPETVGISSQPW
ncbi:hypothetical protein LEMLEM_LOCUS24574 [Lemmus lemmus]